MPSPFPGMDPWLEGPLWTSIHTQLSVEIARQLAPRLRPRYVPLTEKVFLWAPMGEEEGIAVTAADVRPDVAVAKPGGPANGAGSGATGVISAPPMRAATVMPVRVPQVTVEIRDVENRQLVTAIEVLSPTNKRQGRREYLRKRRRMLLSTSHLIEVDLHRKGRRVPMREPLPIASYFVFLSRAEERPFIYFWPIQLPDPLPKVPVPLLAGDPDVVLDLQAALNSVYDAFNYDLTIDYTRPPNFPLRPEEAAWAQERLRSWRAAPTGT